MSSIIEKLTAVKSSVGSVGKTSSEGVSFKYRSIDGVVNALSQALIDHGVVIHSTSAELIASEQVKYGAKGTLGFRTTLAVEYEWTDGESSITSQVIAESIDSGDKGTAKAMSVAYRIAILQTLTLPTGDRDPDADVYEVHDVNGGKRLEVSPHMQLITTLENCGFTRPVQSEIIDNAIGRHVPDVAKLSEFECEVAIDAIDKAVADRMQLEAHDVN